MFGDLQQKNKSNAMKKFLKGYADSGQPHAERSKET